MKGIWKKISVVLIVVMCLFFAYVDKAEAETAEGSVYFGTLFGIVREDVVNHLTEQGDTLYKNVPYISGGSGVSRQPRDPSTGTEGQLNCAGFVSEVIGHAYVAKNSGKTMSDFINGVFPSLVGENAWRKWDCLDCAASNWLEVVKHNNVIRYSYDSKDEMLNSGRLQKGDIIYMYAMDPKDSTTTWDGDNHMGIYWGIIDGEHKMWNAKSSTNTNITGIVDKGGTKKWIIIPIGEPEPEPEEPDVPTPPRPTTFTITISKKDITTKDELPGTKIQIKDKDGKEVVSFDSGPEEKRITLKAGVYTLKEIATPSPLQACLDNLKEDQERESCNYNPIETELKFEVTSAGKVKLLSKENKYYQIDGTKITIFNDTTPVLKVPDTGAGQTILLVLMGLLTLGSGAFLVYQNTKRKQL